jgi:CHAT domain-containing protein
MRSSSIVVLLLALLQPVVCISQSTTLVRHDDELVSELLSVKTGDQLAASSLLSNHRNLITRRICDSLLQAATTCSALGNSARSLFLCEIAKEAAKQLDDKKLLAFVFYKTGRMQFEQDNISTAIKEFLQSKTLFEEAHSPRDLIYILGELGALHIYSADYKKAEEYSEQSLALAASLKNGSEPAGALPDEYGTAFAWSNLGNVAKWKADYDSALDDFRKSLELWRELRQRGFWSAGNIADALVDIGHVYQVMGDHIQALNYLSQAMDTAKTLLDKGRTAAVLNDMGVLYIEQGDYLKASEFVNQSLKIFMQVNNRREIARNFLNLGVIDYRQGKHEVASQEFRNSLTRAKEIDAVEIIIAAQEGLGSVCQAQADYAGASAWFDKALSLAQTIGDKIRITELLWRKGQVFYSQGDYARSSTAANNAADLASQIRSPLMNYLALTLKGKAYRAQNEKALASESFAQGIEAVEHMRDQIAGAEKEQQLFFENRISPYLEMVSMLIQQGKAEEALKYAERAKGRVLLDVFRNGRINVNKSLSQTEQSEERRLYGEMVSLNTQIRGERMRQQPDETRIEELETRLQKARNSYEAFQAGLYATHPELRVKRGLFPAFTIEDAGEFVSDTRTTVLEYVVTDEQTFLFVLTRDATTRGKVNVGVYSININKSALSAMVERFRNVLSTNHPGFRQTGLELYDLLIKPAEPYLNNKTTVCIVPDDTLWNLPFQALQNARDKYLLELYAIYYAPSLQVLREMRKRSDSLRSLPLSENEQKSDSSLSRVQTAQLYAVGNPALGGEALARAQTLRNSPFAPLPETENEVETLAAEVYGRQVSLVRIGSAAREGAAKTEMSKYRVLHFATHGVFDDRNPLYSYIVFASGGDSSEDGLLEAWEIMDMELNANMAVLSACDSARGRVGAGEGLIGMTWALFVAGVPTTVASQWAVPSNTTAKLMVAFHENAKTVSKAEALRQAPLQMIKDQRFRMKPYYWAGFVVVGDGGN